MSQRKAVKQDYDNLKDSKIDPLRSGVRHKSFLRSYSLAMRRDGQYYDRNFGDHIL